MKHKTPVIGVAHVTIAQESPVEKTEKSVSTIRKLKKFPARPSRVQEGQVYLRQTK
jgi:hypothetical protein